jgi:hypothetical protein
VTVCASLIHPTRSKQEDNTRLLTAVYLTANIHHHLNLRQPAKRDPHSKHHLPSHTTTAMATDFKLSATLRGHEEDVSTLPRHVTCPFSILGSLLYGVFSGNTEIVF